MTPSVQCQKIRISLLIELCVALFGAATLSTPVWQKPYLDRSIINMMKPSSGEEHAWALHECAQPDTATSGLETSQCLPAPTQAADL